MKSHGRARARTLSWTQSKEIRENIAHTLDGGDPFFGTVIRYGTLLTEIRFVRNQAAHHNSGTRASFRKVLKQYYGGVRKGITPGLLLLTLAHGKPCLLERYIISCRVFLKELVRA